MKNTLLILIALIIFSSQITAQTKEEKKEQKELKSQKEYEAMKDLVNSKSYEFSADWISSTGSRINIASGSNTITIAQDSATAGMQYFGTVTNIGVRGSEGVSFDNVMKNYKIKFDDRKKKVAVSFTVKNKSENFDINLTIFSSGKAYADVYSNHKSNVTYDGNVTAVKKE